MMPRYIDADWITQKLDGWQDQLAETYGQNDEYVLCLGEVLMKLDDTPTADVVERKRGKWKQGYCSECGYNWGKDAPIASVPNFCPNCGAEMKGEDDDKKRS